MEPVEYQIEISEADENLPNPQSPVINEPEKERAGALSPLQTILLVLLFLLLLIMAAIGTELLRTMKNRIEQLEGELETVQRQQEVLTESSNAPAAYPTILNHVVTNEGTKDMTPASVYENYAGCVAAIRNEGTYSNVFGQETAFASSGTGFVISEDGYLLTNNHVIEDAEKITVAFDSGETYEAAVVGSDATTDIALLKIEANGLKTVSIGNSDTILVGEQVCAIGNPLGELTNTLTAGYVSALDRDINLDGTPYRMLQTDCAINEGNSGGPLFDMNGNVIGITSAKYYGTTIEGIGFAIPVNTAMQIAAELQQYGYVRGRPLIGVTVQTAADEKGNPIGSRVIEVVPGGSADQCGISEGDLIVGLDDYPVTQNDDLLAALKQYHAGDSATIKWLRDGNEYSAVIVFSEKR